MSPAGPMDSEQNSDWEREWRQLMDRLHEQVLLALKRETIENEAEIARLAADYESYCRMRHAPARAVRLAEQLLFQRGRYAEGEQIRQLALEVTATLARIYRDWRNSP